MRSSAFRPFATQAPISLEHFAPLSLSVNLAKIIASIRRAFEPFIWSHV